MLDKRSLNIIARFKSAVLTRAYENENPPTVTALNRGKKLQSSEKQRTMKSKIVEYEGSDRLVFTNENIERSNYRRKRRWLEFYGSGDTGHEASAQASSDSEGSSISSDGEEENKDESVLEDIRISEILAPLSHPSELATHPAISKTYKLSCLPDLASAFIELIEVEQNTLNQLNKLLRVLNGEDWYFFLEERLGLPIYDHGLDDQDAKLSNERNLFHEGNLTANEPLDGQDIKKQIEKIANDEHHTGEDPFFALPQSLIRYEANQSQQFEKSDFTSTDELENVQQDLINYLQLSVQRQQEYIKNLTLIRNGIVKADRYRIDLQRWGKEMSERKN